MILTTVLNVSYPPLLIQLLILPLIFSSVKSIIILFELTGVVIMTNILYFFTDNLIAVNLPIITTATIILAYSATRNMAVYLTYGFNILLIGVTIFNGVGVIDMLLITISIVNLIINFRSFIYKDDDNIKKIATIIDGDIDKTILNILPKIAKKEKKEIDIITYDKLENYDYVMIFSYNDNIDFAKLYGKKVLLFYNRALFDDNVSIGYLYKMLLSKVIFYGRYNIRRIAKRFNRSDVDIEVMRLHIADFINGAKVALPAYLNISPNFIFYIIMRRFFIK